jgi:hypothetical protein
MDKQLLYNAIKLKRPSISDKTIYMHIENLSRVLNILQSNELNKLNNITNVLESLKNKSENTKKAYISSIFVILDSLDKPKALKYHIILTDLLKNMNDKNELQIKTEKQKDNWVTYSELVACMKRYEKDFKDLYLFKKKKLDESEFKILKNWLITALYVSGNEPRRLEYRDMKIINIFQYDSLEQNIKDTNNYIIISLDGSMKFSFGNYKTKSKFGIQLIPINKYLQKVINYYIKYSNNKKVLFDVSGSLFSKWISDAFNIKDKNLSLNMIRHIYVSEKYPANTQERKKVAENMGHSLYTNINYSLL